MQSLAVAFAAALTAALAGTIRDIRAGALRPGWLVVVRWLFGALIGGLCGWIAGLVVVGGDDPAETVHVATVIAPVLLTPLGTRSLSFWGWPQAQPDVDELRRRRDVGRLADALLDPRGPHALRDDLAARAAGALGEVGGPGVAEPLAAAALHSPWEPVRRAALEALETVDPDRAAALKEPADEAGDVPLDPSIRRLPPGHVPGPQTRRIVAADTQSLEGGWFSNVPAALLLAIYGLMALRFVAGAGVLGPGLTDYLVLVAASIPVFGLFVLGERVDRSGAAQMSLELETTEYRRGDSVTVDVVVERGRGGPLEVWIECTETYEGVGRTDELSPLAIVAQRSSEHARTYRATACRRSLEKPHAGDFETVVLEIPADAPFSYEGEVVSLSWELTARLRRRWRGASVASEPIWVAP